MNDLIINGVNKKQKLINKTVNELEIAMYAFYKRINKI